MSILHYKNVFTGILIVCFVLFSDCVSDPPEATGTFRVQFSGDKDDLFEGFSYFNLAPSNANGIITVRLDVSESTFLRLSFFNPDPAQIFLEPGSYSIVDRLAEDVVNEVLVDFIDPNGSFKASSGQVRIGIVKNSQIKGEIDNAEFILLNSRCSGSFDAIPQ